MDETAREAFNRHARMRGRRTALVAVGAVAAAEEARQRGAASITSAYVEDILGVHPSVLVRVIEFLAIGLDATLHYADDHVDGGCGCNELPKESG